MSVPFERALALAVVVFLLGRASQSRRISLTARVLCFHLMNGMPYSC